MATLSGVLIIRIVADLGTPAVAAVTAGQRVNFILIALLMGMGAATMALVARAWGAQDKPLAIAYTRLSLKVASVLTLAFTVIAVLLAPAVADFFQLTGESRTLTIIYIRWMSLFCIAQALSMTLSTANRATGDAKTPLYIGIVSNSSSVLLVYALAYGKWGLPALGVKGAAIGWGIAFSCWTLLYFAIWISNRLSLKFSLPALKDSVAPRVDLRLFLTVCLPATIEQIIMQGAMLLFVGFIADYGTAAFAAYGVGIGLFGVVMVIGLGFSIASSALVGQQLGAGNHQRAIDSAKYALRLSLGTMIVMGVASALLADTLAALMVNDPEVIRLTAQFIWALAFMQPLLSIDFTLGGAMRGAGDTRFPLIAGIATILGIRLPLAAFISWQGWPLQWLFGVFILDQLVKSALIWHRFQSKRWLRALEE